jgi:hypothetical protein
MRVCQDEAKSETCLNSRGFDFAYGVNRLKWIWRNIKRKMLLLLPCLMQQRLRVVFAGKIEVSVDTIRNWEQGKRCPTGAALAALQ